MARLQHPEKGLKRMPRQKDGITYYDTFIGTSMKISHFTYVTSASEFVIWMIRSLFLLDKKHAVATGRKLQEKGFISCVCRSQQGATSSSS